MPLIQDLVGQEVSHTLRERLPYLDIFIDTHENEKSDVRIRKIVYKKLKRYIPFRLRWFSNRRARNKFIRENYKIFITSEDGKDIIRITDLQLEDIVSFNINNNESEHDRK